MTNKTLCDRCEKVLEPWRGEFAMNFIVNLWKKNKRKQNAYDLCEDCKKEFGKFMGFDKGGLSE